MSDGTALKPLFTSLHGSLPYEYDVLYVTTEDTGDSIAISKAGSAGVIYITESAPDEGRFFDIVAYDDAYNDEPTEACQWDADDPNSSLMDLIDYVETSL